MKLLDDLAWKIGRDDAAQELPPVRCLKYRADKAKKYLDGYAAGLRQLKDKIQTLQRRVDRLTRF